MTLRYRVQATWTLRHVLFRSWHELSSGLAGLAARELFDEGVRELGSTQE